MGRPSVGPGEEADLVAQGGARLAVAIVQGEGICSSPPPTRLDSCPECNGSGQTFIEDKTSTQILSVLTEIRDCLRETQAK